MRWFELDRRCLKPNRHIGVGITLGGEGHLSCHHNFALAQAIGRWGNWFNGELFGRPLDTSWALSIPAGLRPVGYEEFETFHPTFLYESLWCIVIAVILIYMTPKFSGGAIFALYVAGYSAGRFFIEGLRIDQAHTFGGLRLNQYVAALLFLLGMLAFNRFSRSKR